MKILVIFTGGTIGSKLNEGWISPDTEAKHILIENYKSKQGKDVEFVVREPYSILSENLSAKSLNALMGAVDEGLQGRFDGIIVTHGTDTLQYSASALCYTFGCDTLPIVLVSSNYPLSDERANGHANFSAAVEFIKSRAGRGVFVAYKNKGDTVRFHRGHLLLTHREADDKIYSINDLEYASINDGKIELTGKDAPACKALGVTELVESPRILVINALPGDDYMYTLEGYRAVILRPYHSGTLNTASEKLRAFCDRAREKNIPVYMVNARTADNYESVRVLDELNIIASSESFASLYMKLWISM